MSNLVNVQHDVYYKWSDILVVQMLTIVRYRRALAQPGSYMSCWRLQPTVQSVGIIHTKYVHTGKTLVRFICGYPTVIGSTVHNKCGLTWTRLSLRKILLDMLYNIELVFTFTCLWVGWLLNHFTLINIKKVFTDVHSFAKLRTILYNNGLSTQTLGAAPSDYAEHIYMLF